MLPHMPLTKIQIADMVRAAERGAELRGHSGADGDGMRRDSQALELGQFVCGRHLAAFL